MKKILIVDDDRIFAKVLKDALIKVDAGKKFEVFTAINGEEGLQKAKELKPDLILLDVVMPKMGGIETLKKIKDDKEIFETPVIIGTQLSDMEKMSEAVEIGVKGYVIKSETSIESIIKQIEDSLKED